MSVNPIPTYLPKAATRDTSALPTPPSSAPPVCLARVPSTPELYDPDDASTGTQRLAHVVPAFLHVIQIILLHRVSLGDSLTARAADSKNHFLLAELAPLIAFPRLYQAMSDGSFCTMAYTAALEARSTPFDVADLDDLPPLDRYLKRLVRFGDVSNSVFLTMMVYIDRLTAMCPSMFLTSRNIHRLLATTFLIAAKIHEDRHLNMENLAVVAGLELSDAIRLESELLKMLDFRAHVTVHDFAAAEAIFVAEAIDTIDGLTVFRELVDMNVGGMDQALSVCDTWKPVRKDPDQNLSPNSLATPIPVRANTGDSSSAATTSSVMIATWGAGKLGSGGKISTLWPPAPRTPDPATSIRSAWRVRELAKAQLAFDYRTFDLKAARALQADTEQQIKGLFGDSGLARYHKLRLLADGHDMPDSFIPPLYTPTTPLSDSSVGACEHTEERLSEELTWDDLMLDGSEDEGLIPRTQPTLVASPDDRVIDANWKKARVDRPRVVYNGEDKKIQAAMSADSLSRSAIGTVAETPNVPPGFEGRSMHRWCRNEQQSRASKLSNCSSSTSDRDFRIWNGPLIYPADGCTSIPPSNAVTEGMDCTASTSQGNGCKEGRAGQNDHARPTIPQSTTCHKPGGLPSAAGKYVLRERSMWSGDGFVPAALSVEPQYGVNGTDIGAGAASSWAEGHEKQISMPPADMGQISERCMPTEHSMETLRSRTMGESVSCDRDMRSHESLTKYGVSANAKRDGQRASKGLGLLAKRRHLWPRQAKAAKLIVAKRRTRAARISMRDMRSMEEGDRRVFVGVMGRIFRH